MPFWLGLDVGTTGTRAVVVDESGKVCAAASSDHAPMAQPQPTWAEQDPEDWWRAAQEAIRAALSQGNCRRHRRDRALGADARSSAAR